MKMPSTVIGLALLAGLAFAGPGRADEAGPGQRSSQTAPAFTTLRGEIVKVDGESYVVKDETGKEVRLQVDKDSRVIGTIRPGVKIEAQVSPNGHAVLLKVLM